MQLCVQPTLGASLWTIQRIPFSMAQSSFRGRPRCPVRSGGDSCCALSHCSFISSYRFMCLFLHKCSLCAIFIFQTVPKEYAPPLPCQCRIQYRSLLAIFMESALSVLTLRKELSLKSWISMALTLTRLPALLREHPSRARSMRSARSAAAK